MYFLRSFSGSSSRQSISCSSLVFGLDLGATALTGVLAGLLGAAGVVAAGAARAEPKKAHNSAQANEGLRLIGARIVTLRPAQAKPDSLACRRPTQG
ncbi:MAG: hypothetical protein WDO56_31370 [Gammaproteobacteria bacterium]